MGSIVFIFIIRNRVINFGIFIIINIRKIVYFCISKIKCIWEFYIINKFNISYSLMIFFSDICLN